MLLQAGFVVISNGDDSNSDNTAITMVHKAFSKSVSPFPLPYVIASGGSREEMRQDPQH